MVKPSTVKITPDHVTILDLEKKYMKKLSEIFSSEKFHNSLLDIKKDIYNIDLNDWKINPIQVAFERLIHYIVYKELDIKKAYPSPISGDVAVVLGDCVLNIDAKTLSFKSNKKDIEQIQLSKNQTSFKNNDVETDSGTWPYPVALQSKYYDKPILTFFLTCHYDHKAKGDFRDFKYFSHEQYKNLVLVSVPNGEISEYFNNNLIYGFKDYTEIGAKLLGAKGGETKIVFTDKDQAYRGSKNGDEAKNILIQHGMSKKFFQNTVAAKTQSGFNFICNKTGFQYMYKKIKGKDKYSFSACQAGTARVHFEPIEQRFDSDDNNWKGIEYWNIN